MGIAMQTGDSVAGIRYGRSMSLSKSEIERYSTAAKHLAEASKDLPLLRAMDWPEKVEKSFFRHKAERLPVVSYEPIDVAPARAHIAEARQSIDGDNPVAEWLTRTADQLETQTALIETRGSKDFLTHSADLFGKPDNVLIDRATRTIDFARHVDETLAGLDVPMLTSGPQDPRMSARKFANELRRKLGKYFTTDDMPEIVFSKTMSSRVAASSQRIRIRSGETFTQMDVRQLLQHEALIHTATGLNGKAQEAFPILGRAHPGTTMIQEGLAVFAEIITGAIDPTRFRRLADRVIAIDMAINGADFIEVYRFYLERTDNAEAAYDNTQRIFRGGVMSGGAPFTKDMVYLNGLLRVHNFLRTAVRLNRSDLICLVFVGKLDLEDVPAMALLVDCGALSAPKILPPWASDLRFVVSYLSYSSFLNRIKLPGFQSYYEDRLANVPSLWGKLA